MASIMASRKSRLLDVLSKIVSVAKSKVVDPAMFTLTNEENQVGKDAYQVDWTKIKDRVAQGVICETLTEKLRKARITKEAMLLQKI
ncbi:unnamed protein product [Peronospora effusa]|nr:unnamed protein product [Peronospora effusa]